MKTPISDSERMFTLGYQQAQLDILRHLLKGNNLYLGGDKMEIARTVLGFTTSPIPIRVPELDPAEIEEESIAL